MSLLKRIGGPETEADTAVTTRTGMTTQISEAATTRPDPTSIEPSRAALLRDKLNRDNETNAAAKQKETAYEIKNRIQTRLIEEMERRKLSTKDHTIVRKYTQEIFQEVLAEENMVLSKGERAGLLASIQADITGFGPLEPLLSDDTVSEVMVNGPYNIFVERKGKITKSTVTFRDNDHAMLVVERILAPLGRRCDESSPMVDARLPDGSRVNIIIPPLALDGPTITIRKFSKKPLSIDDLIRFGSVTPEVGQFLKACVTARLNSIVSGGTGSGKTTLLNVLSSFIPEDERLITVENAAELQLQQEHVIRLESKPANVEGKGEITIRDLVINALRMRPERIIVGECRGGETLDMLQAMNTGHEGSMTTLHANSPKDALSRIETMVLMAGMDLPVRAIREQIASAIEVVIQQARLADGTRRVTSVTQIEGMEGDIIKYQEIFRFEQNGIDENGKIVGQLRPTGVIPQKFIEKFEERNIFLPPNLFTAPGMRY